MNKRNTYLDLKQKHQKMMDDLPIKFAFGDDQLHRMFKEWGINENNPEELKQVVSIGYGGYMLRKDVPKLEAFNKQVKQEKEEALAADPMGTGYIYEMFYYELCNHEYGYTGDVSAAIASLGYTLSQIQSDPALLRGYTMAKQRILQED